MDNAALQSTAKIFPYESEEMTYKPHPTARYVLTPEYVKTVLGIDLSDRGLVVGSNPSMHATRTLDRVSRKVYRYCLENAVNTELMSLIMAKAPSVRNHIRDMMLAEIEYEMSGVSPIITRDRERVSPETEEIANNITIPEIGTVIRYCGELNFGLGLPNWMRGDY